MLSPLGGIGGSGGLRTTSAGSSSGTSTVFDPDLGIPLYAVREHWPRIRTRLNAYPGEAPLPERCRAATLPKNETRQKAPNGAMTGACFQLDLRGPEETQPVLPTIFVPGFPKAATTWLYDCMHAAFPPEMVCPPQSRDEFDGRRWSIAGCGGRRFMLPGIACRVVGGCEHRKELFFYGSGFSSFFQNGLAGLHGPELPLEMFQLKEEYPQVALRRAQVGKEDLKVQRMETFCTHPNHTHLPAGRMHPSCCVARTSDPKRWECRWHETLRKAQGRTTSMWFQTAMPWVKPHEYNFAATDFTPNYMCTPQAMANIKLAAKDPRDLRFIVLMRDPIMRTFSEWSMFALGWGWDHEPDFLKKMHAQMRAFERCNATLFHRIDLVKALPDDELFAYITQCFRGKAMEYITNSIYPVCVLGALRFFPKEQFLFLRFEDMKKMHAPGLLRLLANFTGLHTDDEIIARLQGERQCEMLNARKKPLSFGKDKRTVSARANLSAAMGEFEAFFQPYDELLSELVDPNFKWGADTHRLSADVLIDAPGSKKGRGRGKGLGTGRGSREERPAAGYRKAIKSAKAEAKAMLGDDLQLLRGKARLAAIGAAKGRGAKQKAASTSTGQFVR